MGTNNNYNDIELPVPVESEGSIRHTHDFDTEDKKCKICGKTIEELLEDI
jgi:ligand-binding SRPBCC domain-containing protein